VADISYLDDIFSIVHEERIRRAEAEGIYSLGVTEEDRSEAVRWANGRELQNIEHDSGCALLMEKLRSLAERDIDNFVDTIKISPLEKDRILEAHMDAYSSSRVYNWLRNEIELDREAAKNVPQVIKEGYLLTKGTPVGPAE